MALLGLGVPAGSPLAGAESPSAAACVDGIDDPRPALLAELNRRRVERGFVGLRFSGPLCAVATRFAARLVDRGELSPEMRDLDRLERETAAAGARADRLLLAIVQLRPDPAGTWDALAGEHPSIGREALSGDLLDFGAGLATFEGAPVATLLFSLPRTETLARRLATFADRDAILAGVLAATNEARRQARREPLERDPALDAIAQAHAERMLREQFFGHVDPKGRDLGERVALHGYQASALGENLARGLFAADEVVERWLASSGHRRNIAHPRFRSIGLGLAYDPAGDEESVHWVQIFSSEPPAATP